MNTIQLNSVDKPRRENFTLTWRRIYWVQTALPELRSQWFGKLGKLLRKWKGWGHEEHPQFFRQVTANRWCVSFSLCVYVYLYSPPKKKKKNFRRIAGTKRRKREKWDFICRQTYKSELPFTFRLCAPFVDCFARLPCRPKSRQYSAASGHRKSQMERRSGKRTTF